MSAENTAPTVENLEHRAAAMEKTLADLKQQVGGHGGDSTALQARLQELLKLMLEDRDECEAIRAQRDSLKEENERLKQQVAKGEYRVKHLLRTIDEIESKQTN